MSDDSARNAEERATEYAELAGRLEFFTTQLVALAQLGEGSPAGFLRERLRQLAEQATSHDLVNPDDVARDLAHLRSQVEYWRQSHGKGRAR